MSTKTWLGGLIAGILYFFIGWLVFGILTMDFYRTNMTPYTGISKNPPDMVFIGLGNLAWGLLLAYVLNRSGVRSAAGGFTTGLVITLLMMLGVDLLNYATLNLYNQKLLGIDILLNALMGGVIGAVVGWWLGRGRTAAPAA
ncbi:MAG TPA: hypothetical protein VG870_00960 [Chitinophagaceae bacterium]|nr:hypothetical protein [Chitinophagaceae bacterium]